MAETPGSVPGESINPDRSKRGLQNLRPPWTPEEQLEAARKGGKARKAYSLRGALARKLKARRADGTRPWDAALDAFVEKLLQGDVRAIELAMQSVDGPLQTAKTVTTTTRELVIRPDGDRRGMVTESVSVETAQVQPELGVTTDSPPNAT